MVNGIIGSKEIKDNSVIKVLDFVIFEMMYYNEKNKMTTETQLKLTQSLGFKTCLHEKYKYDYLTYFGDNTVEKSNLLKLLLDYRLKSEYDIDGIIITDNVINEQNKQGNPDYSFAFKSLE